MTTTKKKSALIGFLLGYIYGIYPAIKAIFLLNETYPQGIGLNERLIQTAIALTMGFVYGIMGMAIGFVGSIIYEKTKG